MIGKRSLMIYGVKGIEIILTIRLDQIHFFLHDKVFVDEPKHIRNIQNHIIRDIFKHKSKLIIIKRCSKSCSMFVESICSI
jgi:hypothetical protein